MHYKCYLVVVFEGWELNKKWDDENSLFQIRAMVGGFCCGREVKAIQSDYDDKLNPYARMYYNFNEHAVIKS